MFSLTQLETTSKTCQQTSVNLVLKLISSTMDIVKKAGKLQKKIDKLGWQKNNDVLTKEQKYNKQKEIDKIRNK